MIYIYNPKDLQNPTILNGELEDFKQNPIAWYNEWSSDLIATDKKFNYPKIVDGVIVEKSQEELKLEGVLPLADGEIISKDGILAIPKPNGYKIVWDGLEWIEAITKQELVAIRLEKMVKYAEVEENKNKISTLKFTSENEIKILDSELSELEKEINKISNDINSML